MHLSCPQCQTSYEIEEPFNSTSVVCHRCGIEFSISIHTDSPAGEDKIQSTEPVDSSMEPPRPKRARIWTWLAAMLIVVATAGFWLQQDAWVDNRWVRSTAINLGVPVMLRDKDWNIDPESVHAEWLNREDGNNALVISGKVKNLLSSELLPPIIEIIFFSKHQTDKPIASKYLRITLKPGSSAIRSAPYEAPAPDTTPVAPLGTREFVFVIESLPEYTGNFSLIAHAE